LSRQLNAAPYLNGIHPNATQIGYATPAASAGPCGQLTIFH